MSWNEAFERNKEQGSKQQSSGWSVPENCGYEDAHAEHEGGHVRRLNLLATIAEVDRSTHHCSVRLARPADGQ